MANHEKHGAQGKMYLKRDWEESSSTHTEDIDDIWLEASVVDDGVVLVKQEGRKNFIRVSDSDLREMRTTISVQDLVLLIEKHGRCI